MRPIPRWMRYALLLMLMSASGCAANTRETMTCCRYLEPITMSEHDTTETREQIVDYLIIYEALCHGD